MGRDRKKGGDGEKGAPAWMCTFADLMSLLLCFFVLLLSFSTIQEEDFKEAMMSLKGALGVLPKNVSVIAPQKPAKRRQRSAEEIARKIKRRMQMRDKQNDVKVEFDQQGGVKIILANKILFDTARAELKGEAGDVLTDLASVLADFPQAFFEVRGHTDDRALRSSAKFRDNHDLSWGRADSVARFLAGTGKMDLDHLQITGCGPGEPIATNDTPEGRQANRRVEIHVRGLSEPDTIEQLEQSIGTVEGLTSAPTPTRTVER